DGDGRVELYLRDMILDAHTGTIIINTGANTDNQWREVHGGPVAVDIDDPTSPNPALRGNADLELVSGGTIYRVNLGSRTFNSGSLTPIATLPNYRQRNQYYATSVADYDQDGYIDVIISGSDANLPSPGNGYRANTTVFLWKVHQPASPVLTFNEF